MIKKTNVCSHSYFFLPKAYPNIWRAQLLSPESGELAHSNMYFRTSGHVMLSSSSSKKQRFSSISHQVLFTRFLFSCHCTMYKTGSIILYRNTLSLNSLVQVFSILPKLQLLNPWRALLTANARKGCPLVKWLPFRLK